MKHPIHLIGLAAAALALTPTARPAQESVTSPFQTRDLAFTSADLQLEATLLLPNVREGRVPGVAIIHGSGDSDRANPWTRAYAQALACRGIAVLHPDKRGSGQSGGDWRSATLSDLANDALAALRCLRKEPGLDPDRLGLIGFSQGGDILPLAASREAQVSFTIDISGSVVPMAEQLADEVELSARRAGCAQPEIDLLLRLNEKGLQFVRSGLELDWVDYENDLISAKRGALRGSTVLERFPDRRDHPALTSVRHLVSYDPMLFWKQVTVPKLFVFGGRDTQVRVDKSLRRLQSELAKDNNYSVLLFNPNGHALFREDLCDFLVRWIKQSGQP
ncbi:MAG: alpha/beta fold hydrolase [Verrucomicrobiota bacterium]